MWTRAISFSAPLTSCGEVDSWVSSHKLSYLAVPKYISQGMHTHRGLPYRFLVMPCLGEDIEKKFVQAGRQFGVKTVCYLALRLVRAGKWLSVYIPSTSQSNSMIITVLVSFFILFIYNIILYT